MAIKHSLENTSHVSTFKIIDSDYQLHKQKASVVLEECSVFKKGVFIAFFY